MVRLEKKMWERLDDNSICWTMKEIKGIYPVGINAIRKFMFGEKSITVTTIINNNGKVDLPTNIAEHNYFVCPTDEVLNVTINGNNFHPEAAQAIAQFNPWQDKNTIDIPSIGKLQFNTSGYDAFAQWSQPNAPFVCIEPIEIIPPGSNDFMEIAPKIKPGETKIFEYTISL